MGTLYLLPSSISDEDIRYYLPAHYPELINQIRVFVVEDMRTARRFLRKAGYTASFDETTLIELNEHNQNIPISEVVPLQTFKNQDIGLLSEAGVPCVADPGAKLVAYAHLHNVKVKPITGPSSLLLALMASGFNGQNFVFHGYLPAEASLRNKRLKEIELQSGKLNQTQLFIETPYRNKHLFSSICEICHPETYLCIAKNITGENEYIVSKPIKEWKKTKIEFHKENTVFLIYLPFN